METDKLLVVYRGEALFIYRGGSLFAFDVLKNGVIYERTGET